MKSLITERSPASWQELEELVAAILAECGMSVQRNATLTLPRGTVDVDVYAEEVVDGISHRTICECKNWSVKVPKAVAHGFRSVMAETGANRGYIISTKGFQAGALEAVAATNIELLTFEAFQRVYFKKWFGQRLWAVEREVKGFHSYYEPPFGPPGYARLRDASERAAYDAVWNKYHFAGVMLRSFSPYSALLGREGPLPALPFDCSGFDESGIWVPNEVRAAMGYRELLSLLATYGVEGREALRRVNPITRQRLADENGESR